MPEVSIIIRTYNEEKHLGNLFRAIKKQDYKNHEVIIVDSGSTDKTLEIAEEFKAKIIKIETRDFTFGYALNVGCREASGKYLVFVSAHVLPVDHKWLSNLTAPFKDKKIAMAYGRQLGAEASKFSEKRDFKKLFGPLPSNDGAPLNYANNANAAIRKDLWEKRDYDERLFGLEDMEWAKYHIGKGFIVHYVPKAVIYHFHEEQWHQIFNRYRREAIAAFRIKLKRPPQVKLDVLSLATNLFVDTLSSFPNWSRIRLEEILRFRYYQWKGSRQGWYRDRGLNIDKDTEDILFPLSAENEAVVIEGKQSAKLKKIPVPKMRPGDILLKVEYVGVCRTDIEVYEGSLGYYRDGLAKYPIVPGHEFSGTIVRVGANNKYQEWFKPGDKVVGECILSRGAVTERKEVGVINHNGAYSKYVIVPGSAVHHVPAGLDLKIAALAEPLAVVLRSLRRVRGRLPAESKIGVVGAGPIGNLTAQVLTLEGHKVTVFDKNPERLKLLKNTVKKTSTDIEGLGQFGLIVEATGSGDALNIVLKDSSLDSTLLLLGFPYADISYNFEDLVGFEKVIVGSVGAESRDFSAALNLLTKLDMSFFVNKVLSLNDFEKAWELQRLGYDLKILLQP